MPLTGVDVPPAHARSCVLADAVSMELHKRYPSKRDGELTHMRSALVSNVHLGRLLVRRLGVQTTLAFFRDSSSRFKDGQLEKICDFIQEVSQKGAPLTIANALESHIKAITAADADDSRALMRPISSSNDDPAYYGKRGIDLRKPTGDTYEAIVGLLLHELGGDVDATWAVLVRDFFPSDGDDDKEEQDRQLAQALSEARKASALLEQRRRLRKQGKTLAGVTVDVTDAVVAAEESIVGAGSQSEKRARGTGELDPQGTCKRCKRTPSECTCPQAAVSQPGNETRNLEYSLTTANVANVSSLIPRLYRSRVPRCRLQLLCHYWQSRLAAQVRPSACGHCGRR